MSNDTYEQSKLALDHINHLLRTLDEEILFHNETTSLPNNSQIYWLLRAQRTYLKEEQSKLAKHMVGLTMKSVRGKARRLTNNDRDDLWDEMTRDIDETQ